MSIPIGQHRWPFFLYMHHSFPILTLFNDFSSFDFAANSDSSNSSSPSSKSNSKSTSNSSPTASKGKTLIIAEKPSVARAIADAMKQNGVGTPRRTDGYIECGQFIISWCFGHLLELLLPKDYDNPRWKSWALENLPIFPDTFLAKVRDDSSVKSHFNLLKGLIKNAAKIIHAGDPDREGQLIVDELFYYLGMSEAQITQVSRVMISDLSVPGILKAFNNQQPNGKYQVLYQSAIGRQRADWLLGMNLSQAVTVCAQSAGYQGKAFSIGRVFTPLLAMIYRRDKEIEEFVPHDFYNIFALVTPISNPGVEVRHSGTIDPNKQIIVKLDMLRTLEAHCPEKFSADAIRGLSTDQDVDPRKNSNSNKANEGIKNNRSNRAKISDLLDHPLLSRAVDEEGRIVNQKFVSYVTQQIQGQYAKVTKFSTNESKEQPPIGYALSDLQQAMFNIFSIPVDETLKITQSLYEKGLVTYPRTDCGYLNESDFKDRHQIINHLAQQVGKIPHLDRINQSNFNPEQKSRIWDSSKVENHSAIIPTSKPAPWDSLSDREQKCYQLIAQRYLIQFMPPAIYSTTELLCEFSQNGPWVFASRAKTMVSPGWKLLTNRNIPGWTSPATTQSNSNQPIANQLTNLTPNNQIEAGFTDEDYDANGNLLSSAQSASEKSTQKLSQLLANQTLSGLIVGDILEHQQTNYETSKTSPPARFNDATLLSAMTHISRYVSNPDLKKILNETDGLGTEATRASIIKKLFDYKYCIHEKGYIKTTQLGRVLIEALPYQLQTPDTTAYWERALSEIARGNFSLDRFMQDIKQGVMNLITELSNSSVERFAAFKGLGEGSSWGGSSGGYKKDGGSSSKYSKASRGKSSSTKSSYSKSSSKSGYTRSTSSKSGSSRTKSSTSKTRSSGQGQAGSFASAGKFGF